MKLKSNNIVNRLFNDTSFSSSIPNKIFWAGIQMSDAFNLSLNFNIRLTAQRQFSRLMKKILQRACKLAGQSVDKIYAHSLKPQLGPCYTNYPLRLAVYASFGLTAYLEFESATKENALLTYMDNYLKDPAEQDSIKTDHVGYNRLVRVVSEIVNTRLILEDLAREKTLSCVEIYRLFIASQQNWRFTTIAEIIKAVILYGDILPDCDMIDMNLKTKNLIKKIQKVSSTYFDRLPCSRGINMLRLGMEWVRDLSQVINDEIVFDNGFSEKENESEFSIPPLSQNKFPEVLESQSSKIDIKWFIYNSINEQYQKMIALKRQLNMRDSESELNNLIDRLKQSINAAGEQVNKWEDMRSDIVEIEMGAREFTTSPVQGNMIEGHEINISLGKGIDARGEIFDKVADVKDFGQKNNDLLNKSKSLSDLISRMIFPNIKNEPVMDKPTTNGILDISRLSLGWHAESVYKRFMFENRQNHDGKPLSVIACDGSGSLNFQQMRMMKTLSTSWLLTLQKRKIQLLSGMYHSGDIRGNLRGPLVQWLYHPEKTPARSNMEAVHSILSMPDRGTGVQSDALSLTFIIDEAIRISKGNNIYMILITDCAWNQSFLGSKSGKEEVEAVFEHYKNVKNLKLHTTLIGLGVSKKTGLEHLVDKVITVSTNELNQIAKVVEKINEYVASCIKENKKK